ncbi:MAG TPA: hypothetical protein VFD00_02970 [Thermoclostridium sp.]|nr:hypothetical protein [Thermoclostridium sp.]
MTYDEIGDGQLNWGTSMENVRFNETGRQVTVHLALCMFIVREVFLLQSLGLASVGHTDQLAVSWVFNICNRDTPGRVYREEPLVASLQKMLLHKQ